MGRFVIAAFKPKPGMPARDGTVLEVFEWASPEAIEKAHANAAVRALWEEFEAVCDYVPIASLAEAAHPFSEFEPLGADGG